MNMPVMKNVIPEGEKYKTFDEWYSDFKKVMIKEIDENNRDFSFQKDPESKQKLYDHFLKIIDNHKYVYGVNLPVVENIEIELRIEL